MLHKSGLHDHAKQYEAEVIEGFKAYPEVLQVYREQMPEVMRKITGRQLGEG